jgi:hypothetical protein
MGWLYMSSMGGHRTPRDYLDAQFACTTPGLRRTILRSAVVKMHTYYAALEIIHPDQPREVVAIVCLVRYNPRNRDGYVFGYKDMDETMGPRETECPVAILDLLTPTTSEDTNEWRERCRRFAEKRANSPKLRHGDHIIFPEPITFTDRTPHSRFEVVIQPHRPRRITLRASNGGHYRISRLEDREFRVERPTS